MKAIGFIDEKGNYHKGHDESLRNPESSTWKHWDHELQRKEFSKEIIQPRVGGKINPAFVEAYPEYSKKYFSQEEIDKTLRDKTHA